MKNTFLIVLIFTTTQLFAQIPSSGLVAYFPFHGNARDTSANKTHGTVTNATLSSDRFGNPNSAYLFSGSGSYISFPATYVQLNRFTYSLWAKVNTLPSNGSTDFALNIGSAGGDQSINAANNYLGSYNGWLGGGYNTSAPHFSMQQSASLSTADWAHVVYVRDSNHVLLFVNNVLVDSIGVSGMKTPYYGSGSVKAIIGARNSMSDWFKGKIDDVCIYNRALSKTEIAQLYNDNSTSVTSLKSEKYTVELYPNPGTGSFTLDLKNSNNSGSAFTVEITNMQGQKMSQYAIENSEEQIIINHQLISGFYIVNLYTLKGELLTSMRYIVE